MGSISVIIPAYNSSQYLSDALNSVFKQKLPNLEVIVVDDGSDPAEKIAYDKIVNEYSNVKILSKENGGAASARNFGVRFAHGEYIAFLDSDDIWLEGKLESQLNIMNEDVNVGLVLGNILVSDENLNIKYKSIKHIPIIKEKIIEHFFQGRIVMNTPTILVRKKIFESSGGFPEDLLYREDHYFLMTVAQVSKIVCDEMCLTIRRERAGSLSAVGDILTEIGKHRPFWIKSTKKFPFLNVKRAEASLLVRLFLFYLRSNRTEDIKQVVSFASSIGRIYGWVFRILSGMSGIAKIIYKLRNYIKNVRL